MIYADNAATTKLCPVALHAMTACMEDTWGNPSSLYTLGQKAKEALEDARERVAACLGAPSKEIYFTSGGSEAETDDGKRISPLERTLQRAFLVRVAGLEPTVSCSQTRARTFL